jgi:hypothetical protein
LELDNPVEIQYVVGNIFRFFLKQNSEQAQRGEEGSIPTGKTFYSFLLTRATRNTYFVPVYLDIVVRIVVLGGTWRRTRVSVLPETHGANEIANAQVYGVPHPKRLAGGESLRQ